VRLNHSTFVYAKTLWWNVQLRRVRLSMSPASVREVKRPGISQKTRCSSCFSSVARCSCWKVYNERGMP
jgi:hypothetical protein